jgi:hypothetical protein
VVSIENPINNNGEGTAPDLSARPDIFHRILRFWDVEQDCLNAPELGDVYSSIELMRRSALHGHPIIIHCTWGWCRSTAFGLAHQAGLWGPGAEKDAVEWLVDHQPNAAPNMRIVEMADNILAQKSRIAKPGKLIDAVMEHSRIEKNFGVVHELRREWIRANAVPFQKYFNLPIDELRRYTREAR